MNRPPTVSRLRAAGSTSLISLISSAAIYRSSVLPTGVVSISPHRSGAVAPTVMSGRTVIRSGSPIVHAEVCQSSGAGISAGFPSGVPLSAQAPIVAIASSLREGSFL